MFAYLSPGENVTLKVARKAEFGYFLTNGEEDLLLHENEATKSLELDEMVDVFLYQDHQGRLAATMHQPKITADIYDWVTVVEVKPSLGVFVDIGIQKDMLVSTDDLPEYFAQWPQVGDRLFCTLELDRKGRLFATPALEHTIVYISQKASKEWLNKSVDATVYRLIPAGALLLTDENMIAFLHNDEMTESLRLGETVNARVTFVREDGRMNVSMRLRKEESYVVDAEGLYSFLEKRGGAMPYSDETDATIIKEKFNLSKAAFKRALGKLMKEEKIYQKEGWTYLKK